MFVEKNTHSLLQKKTKQNDVLDLKTKLTKILEF